ncbi:MAG: hypothetical protein QXI39_09880 [Candidatus Bathyarchaeia archaeon]
MARGCRYSVIDQRGRLNCLFNEDAPGYCWAENCLLRRKQKRRRKGKLH